MTVKIEFLSKAPKGAIPFKFQKVNQHAVKIVPTTLPSEMRGYIAPNPDGGWMGRCNKCKGFSYADSKDALAETMVNKHRLCNPHIGMVTYVNNVVV